MDFLHVMQQVYGKNMAVSDAGNPVLQNADMSKDFGAYEYFMAQYNSIPRSRITPAVQDALAQGVLNEVTAYSGFRGVGFSTADVLKDPQAMFVAMSQPFPLAQSIANTLSGDATLGEQYPELSRIRNVAGAVGVLFGANLPGIDARVNLLVGNEQDHGATIGGAADFVQGTTVSFFGNLFGFEPGKAGFTRFQQQGIFNATVEMTRTETDGVGKTNSLSWMEGTKNEPSYEMNFDDLMLRVDQQDDVYRTRHARPGSPAFGTGVPMGVQLDLSGYTPNQIEMMITQVQSGQAISIPNQYGDPMTFGGQVPTAARRIGAPRGVNTTGILPSGLPQTPSNNADMANRAMGGLNFNTPGASPMPLGTLLSNDEATNFDIALAASSKDLHTGDVNYGSSYSPYEPFQSDWLAQRADTRMVAPHARRRLNRAERSLNANIARGTNPVDETPMFLNDPAMNARVAYDIRNPEFAIDENLGLEDASSSFVDEQQNLEYQRISTGFAPDMSYAAAQMAVNGARMGWRKDGAAVKATDLLDPETLATSNVEYAALKRSGVFNRIGAQRASFLPKNLALPATVGEEADPFANSDPTELGMPVSTHAPRARRRVGSDIGNNPNIPGGAGWATPEAARNRRDKVFGGIDDGTSPMPTSRNARQASPGGGGGFGRYHDDEDPFGPGDGGGDDGGDIGDGDVFGDEAPEPNRRRAYMPPPNRLVQEGLRNGSQRSAWYNPSVNPLKAASRVFGRAITKDFNEWNQETGANQAEFTADTNTLFQGYLAAEADGTGPTWVEDNVPERLRPSFLEAARKGSRSFEGAVGFAKKISPAGVVNFFDARNASDESATRGTPYENYGPMAGYNSPMHGSVELQETTDQVGVVSRKPVVMKDGQVTLDNRGIERATSIAQNALIEATDRSLPSEPASAMATLKSNIGSIITREVEKVGKAMDEQGVDNDAVQKATTRIKDAALHMTGKYSDSLKGDLQGAERRNEPGAGDEASVRHNSKKPENLKDAEEILRNHPGVAQQVDKFQQENGVSLEDMMNSPAGEESVFTDGDMAFQFGGSGKPRGGGGNGRGPGGGMWRGKIGSMMYGAYIGTRMWNMGMGETMREAKEYGNYASEAGRVAGPDTGILGSESGYSARQTIGAMFAGRGANQEFGAFMDIPFYMAAGGDEAGSRMMSSVKAGATTAAELTIGGSILGSLPGAQVAGSALAGVASKLPGIGLAAGATMAVGTGLMEIYNSLNPDKDPLTWGSMFKSGVDASWKSAATEKYFADHPDQNSPDSFLATAGKFLLSSLPGSSQRGVELMFPSQAAKSLTQEQIKPYLTDAQYGSMYPQKNAEVEAAIKASEAFQLYGLDATQSQQATQSLFKTSGIVPTKDAVKMFGKSVQLYGTEAINEAGQYAFNMGEEVGTPEFLNVMEGFSAVTDSYSRNRSMQTANRYAQIGSQVAGYMAPTDRGVPNQLAAQYGINNQGAASNWQRYNQTVSTYQRGPISAVQQSGMAQMAAMSTPYQGQFVSQIGNMAGEAGYDPMTAMAFASSADLSPMQMASIDTVMSGDLRGMSYFANRGQLSPQFALMDKSGNPMSETNGGAAMAVAAQWGGQTNQGWINDASSTKDMAARFLGTSNENIVSAFMQGGTRQLSREAIEASYQAQQASNGLQMRQIALQENYLWGGGADWQNPTSGSSWGLQNTQRAQQYSFQQADFAQSALSMNVSNSYAAQREGNQYQRMSTSQNYNLWSQDFSHNQQVQQQGWTQQDWTYQDTSRELSYEWGQTDLNEAIRFAGGRERKQLIRQKDRAATSFNLEGEQIDTQRTRQTELWAQEEERFGKQKTYTLELNELDKQSFDTNRSQRVETFQMEVDNLSRKRSELEQQKSLEEEIITSERKYQYDSIQLQKEAAGMQNTAAQKQHEYQVALELAQQHWSDLMGNISDTTRYEPAYKYTTAMKELVTQMAAVGTQPEKIADMMSRINGVNVGNINLIIQMLFTLSSMGSFGGG